MFGGCGSLRLNCAERTERAGDMLNVMSFNIAGAYDEDEGVNAWTAQRAPLNVHTIQRCAPDLIAFQEFHPPHRETYETALPHLRHILGPPTDEEDLQDHNPIYWNPARLTLLDSGGFYLSRTPERWSRDWDSVYVRAATWGRFQDLETDASFIFLNTHFDHIGEQAHVEGAGVLLKRVQGLAGEALPVVLAGDFNCNAYRPPGLEDVETTFTDASYYLFAKHGFRDTFIEAGHHDSPESNTHHNYDGSHYDPRGSHTAWRIDWILVRNGGSCAVFTRRFEIVRAARLSKRSLPCPDQAELRANPIS